MRKEFNNKTKKKKKDSYNSIYCFHKLPSKICLEIILSFFSSFVKIINLLTQEDKLTRQWHNNNFFLFFYIYTLAFLLQANYVRYTYVCKNRNYPREADLSSLSIFNFIITEVSNWKTMLLESEQYLCFLRSLVSSKHFHG